jgi:hypothetical protein
LLTGIAEWGNMFDLVKKKITVFKIIYLPIGRDASHPVILFIIHRQYSCRPQKVENGKVALLSVVTYSGLNQLSHRIPG